jgi:hypothetical protein
LKKFSSYGSDDRDNNNDNCCNKVDRSPLTDLYENHNICKLQPPQQQSTQAVDKTCKNDFPAKLHNKLELPPPNVASCHSPVAVSKKVMNICFSPFNAVRIIAHRIDDEDNGCCEETLPDEEDEEVVVYDSSDSDDEEEEDYFCGY